MVDDSYRGYRNDPYARGSAGSSEPPATDPLTELARLIGQSDPFGDHNRRAEAHGQADWRNETQQPAYPDQNAGYDDRYGAASDQAHYAQQAGQPGYDDGQPYAENGADPYAANGAGHYPANGADPAYAHYAQHDAAYAHQQGYDGAAYQQERQPHYAEPHAGAYAPSQQDGPPNLGPPPYFGGDQHTGRPDAYDDEAPTSRRRGWLITAAALVGLAVLGTAGAFAYRAVVSGGPPPLITRDARPDKVVLPSPNADNGSNKAPDRLAVGSEQMAPPPEQPINVAVAPPPPAQNAAPAALPMTAGPTTPGFAPIQTVPPAAAPNAPPGTSSTAAAPRKIRTVTISADQEPGGAALAPPRPIVPRAAPTSRDANAPLSLAPHGIPDTPAAPARNVVPGPPMRTTALAPAAPPRTEAAGGHGYYVQVSAQKTQEEARASFRGIQAKYASILQGHAAVFRRKDLGSKGVFYGAQVGPLSHEGATHMCEQLKSAGGSCMIQRN